MTDEFKKELKFFNEICNDVQEDYLLEMATGFRPSETGLPVGIWLSTKQSGGKEISHYARIKAMIKGGENLIADLMYSIDVLPPHETRSKKLTEVEINKYKKDVITWIENNKDLILLFWEDKVSTTDFAALMISNKDKFEVLEKNVTGIDGIVQLSSKNQINNYKKFPLGRIRITKDNHIAICSIIEDADGDRISIGTNTKIKHDLEKFVAKNEESLWHYWNSGGEIKLKKVK